MSWDLVGDRPIWQQLAEEITLQILRGQYPPGCRLPSVREIAALAGVNPNTMQRAMAQLELEGLVMNNRTAGRTVTEDHAVIQAVRQRRAQAAVEACISQLAGLGYTRAAAIECIKEGTQHE